MYRYQNACGRPNRWFGSKVENSIPTIIETIFICSGLGGHNENDRGNRTTGNRWFMCCNSTRNATATTTTSTTPTHMPYAAKTWCVIAYHSRQLWLFWRAYIHCDDCAKSSSDRGIRARSHGVVARQQDARFWENSQFGWMMQFGRPSEERVANSRIYISTNFNDYSIHSG